MFDINSINKRYFEISINVEDEDEKTYNAHLEIEPPKIKTVKKLMTIAETAGNEEKKGTEVVEDLQEAMRIVLNKNKTKYKVPDELIENLDVDQMKGILAEFFDWLGGERKAKKLEIPYYPKEDDDNEGHYEVNTMEEKIVSDYTGYNFADIEELGVFQYWLFLRDAVIYNCNQTEEGQEYLNNCWRINQTKPDIDKLRKIGK